MDDTDGTVLASHKNMCLLQLMSLSCIKLQCCCIEHKTSQCRNIVSDVILILNQATTIIMVIYNQGRTTKSIHSTFYINQLISRILQLVNWVFVYGCAIAIYLPMLDSLKSPQFNKIHNCAMALCCTIVSFSPYHLTVVCFHSFVQWIDWSFNDMLVFVLLRQNSETLLGFHLPYSGCRSRCRSPSLFYGLVKRSKIIECKGIYAVALI